FSSFSRFLSAAPRSAHICSAYLLHGLYPFRHLVTDHLNKAHEDGEDDCGTDGLSRGGRSEKTKCYKL
ncbi:MAG TPA: hypothetical protein VE912_10690, partial [Bacteroidales bacterium]|nr:hypothetical protein [Bacteroidales bacterium]